MILGSVATVSRNRHAAPCSVFSRRRQVMFANKLAFPQTPARPADNANMTSIIKIAASRIAWTNRGASRHSLMAPSSRPEVAA
jgi:hypothetical protein